MERRGLGEGGRGWGSKRESERGRAQASKIGECFHLEGYGRWGIERQRSAADLRRSSI